MVTAIDMVNYWLPKLSHSGDAGVVPSLKVRASAMWL
jgi:hypothetical protein